MKLLLSLASLVIISLSSFASKSDNRYFELRIYYCHPGKLDALIKRFTDHTTGLFEKHGMTNIGYWVPVTNTENALYYILAYPDKESRDTSWKAFNTDPEWKQVSSESEKNGKIVAKVSSVFMNAADISPAIKASQKKKDRLFELRTYYCLPGRLPDLLTRFRDHTKKLFTRHGMTHIAYWTTAEKDSSQSRLVYILAHHDEQAAQKSWAAFRSDPIWIAARDASEANGKIVEKVESLLLKPLSFSKIK